MNEYSFHVASSDLIAAFDCEADRAESEGFKSVEERQRANANHARNALRHMNKICPEGHRVAVKVSFSFTPAVIPNAPVRPR